MQCKYITFLKKYDLNQIFKPIFRLRYNILWKHIIIQIQAFITTSCALTITTLILLHILNY